MNRVNRVATFNVPQVPVLLGRLVEAMRAPNTMNLVGSESEGTFSLQPYWYTVSGTYKISEGEMELRFSHPRFLGLATEAFIGTLLEELINQAVWGVAHETQKSAIQSEGQ